MKILIFSFSKTSFQLTRKKKPFRKFRKGLNSAEANMQKQPLNYLLNYFKNRLLNYQFTGSRLAFAYQFQQVNTFGVTFQINLSFGSFNGFGFQHFSGQIR